MYPRTCDLLYSKDTQQTERKIREEDTQLIYFIYRGDVGQRRAWGQRSQERGVGVPLRRASSAMIGGVPELQTPVSDTVGLEGSAWAEQLAYSGVHK